MFAAPIPLPPPPRPGRARQLPFAALALVGLVAIPDASGADQEKKPEKKPEPPRVIVALPLAVTAGATHRVQIRGHGLAEATDAGFAPAAPHATARIQSKGKVQVPKDQDAKKVGDTRIELELNLASDTPAGTLHLVVTSAHGTSPGHPIVVLPAGALTEEQEPNGGLDQAQVISPGTTVQGSLREDADVDVFRIAGRAGQWLVAEVRAARLGASLDPVLTLHGPGGRILAENDDAPGHRDPRLRFRLPPEPASCYLSLIDAHHRGGPTQAYLLNVRLE